MSRAQLPDPFVIAIDGPAASGKGTLARRLAEAFGLHHLDTGLTYRAVGHHLLVQGLPLDNEALAVAAAQGVDLASLDGSVLSAHAIGEAASRVAVMTAVRRVLVAKQRAFAMTPPGAVLDGRDIGTVVCPDAFVKLFVTATAFARAERRYREIVAGGQEADFARLLMDIQRRDARDMSRADSPLVPAPDSHLLDTSRMDIETAFQSALRIVEDRLAAAGNGI